MPVEKSLVQIENEKAEFRERIKKFIIGAVITLLTTLLTKIITIIFATDSVAEIFDYLINNYSFIFPLLTASGFGGFFAQKWIEVKK